MKRIIFKVLKITGIFIGSILFLLFLTPIIFPGTVAEQIKGFANKSLNGELNFSKARLSFFKHFPSLTLTLYNFSLKGSAPYKNDTLVAANEIALGVNLYNLVFNKRIDINKIFISDAFMNVQVNEKGEANYNVYVAGKKKMPTETDSSTTALRLEKIIVENTHLLYNDQSADILIDAKGFNYTGSGDLSKALFDLASHAKIDTLDFYLGKTPYLLNKKVDADLVTKINTGSLAFFFEKNDLVINRLPVQFSGKLDFMKDGYDMDFTLNAVKANLYDFITALPPQYVTWQEQTKINGITDLLLTLKGKYIASANTMPDLIFNMKIRDGYIKYDKAPLPLTNLFLNLDTKMPSINPDSLIVKCDSLFFNVDKDYLGAVFVSKGLQQPFITANLHALVDLDNLDRALGLPGVEMKGRFGLQITANGHYSSGPNPASLRHENIITSIPAFDIKSHLTGGYIKYDSLPQAISNINFNLNTACPDNNYLHTSISLTDLSATSLTNFIKGHATVTNLQEKKVDANLQAAINLADIKKLYPFKGTQLDGVLKVNIDAKGKYDEVKKTFPATTANITLLNGSVKTAYYPDAINNIQFTARATDTKGTLKDLQLIIEPASFQFEGKPFHATVSLQNFEDIAYRIAAHGEIDVAKVYKVFAIKGVNVNGFIKADLSLQGRQSDATHGRYSLLHNSGTLQVRDIQTSTENFPKPFLIKQGLFTFRQDKMWFDNFLAGYGQSDFNMNGYMQNVIDFALSDKAVLKGNFNVQANYINADEFTAFAPVKKDSQRTVPVAVKKEAVGVIMVPRNLNLTLMATAKKINYSGLTLQDGKGIFSVNQGKITLKEMGFKLVGCEVVMNADYINNGPEKASFNYHLQAKEFDIRRAWNEIKLFHDMATSAGKAQGIVSVDYNLKGVLDKNMHPVYSSLEGGGTLAVKNVKMYGLKMFSTVSQKTGKDSINNPGMAGINIKTTIKNNIINIERFKFKVAGFRPRIEGQTSFDGRINIKMRLGLPPFGIFGIPMRITGTQDNPRVKLGKGHDEDLSEKPEQ